MNSKAIENNITVTSNSQKENIWVPIVKIKVRDKHNFNLINKIIKDKNPEILILESTDLSFNNKTIKFARVLSSNGWKYLNIKSIKTNRYKKVVDFVQIMISKTENKSFFTLAQPGETHPEKDERFYDGTLSESKCGSVADAKLKS